MSSKLKEQLMKKVAFEQGFEYSPQELELAETFIDIILEQQRALESIEKDDADFAETTMESSWSRRATRALASTNAKLKALGCE